MWINIFLECKFGCWMWINILVNINKSTQCEWIWTLWILHYFANHNFLPWTFRQFRWNHRFGVIHFGPTRSSICLLRPGHITPLFALSRHFWMPWWPACILSGTPNLLKGWRNPFIGMPCWTVISPRYCPYGRSADLRQCFSGHPSRQNSFNF